MNKNSNAHIRELIKLANRLDDLGETKLASDLDIIIKEAGWLDYTRQMAAKINQGWENMTQGAKNAFTSELEALKQRAMQGEAAALEALEKISEQPNAIAAGVTKALEEAKKAYQSGYGSELQKQKAETAVQKQRKDQAGASARALEGEAMQQAQRAVGGVGQMASGVAGLPGAAVKDVARGIKHNLPEAPPDLNGGGMYARTNAPGTGIRLEKGDPYEYWLSADQKSFTARHTGTGKNVGPFRNQEVINKLKSAGGNSALDGITASAASSQKRIDKFASALSREFGGLAKSVRR